MMKSSALAIAVIAAWGLQGAQASSLFVPNSTFTVQGGGSPDDFSDTVNLTPGTQSLDGGALDLTISIVPAGGSKEWLVFNYSTVGGGPISPTGGNWTLNQIGLDAAVAVDFIGAYSQFTIGGVAQTPSYSFFGGYSVMANPVPGESGNGLGNTSFSSSLGSGPLGSLGAYIDPWGGYLNGAGINSSAVNGYEQALEFTATVATPEPATWAMLLVGFAGLGLAGYRRRQRLGDAAPSAR